MKMSKIIVLGGLMSGLMMGVVHADNDNSNSNNNCSVLNVVITNLSPEACTLVSASLKHGFYKFSSSVPMFIPAGTSAGPIFLEQSIFGPELELTYSCGNNSITTFSSKQNYCFLSAGDVYGRILTARNAMVDYQSINGSWLWSQHGSINWRIQ